MTLEAPARCSATAEALDEPMIGTIEQRRRWLLVEDRSAWGEKAVRDVLGAEREALAKEHGVRILLVRRREGDPAADAERRVLLVDTVARTMATRTVSSLDEIDVLEAAGMPVEAWGSPLDEPIALVCTNGKRDACCALRGRALVAALGASHPARTWECTHLGGHRFAAMLVCLPHGIVYGRVPPAEGPAVVSAYLDGRVVPELLRGRSPWPAAAQVAELELRRDLGLDGVDAVRLVAADADGDRASVTLVTDAGEQRYELVAERADPPRAISCRADELEQPRHWRVVGHEVR